jgi:N-methylhydantoinase A/oxoprolinase/acetone carboxylase beta subunit
MNVEALATAVKTRPWFLKTKRLESLGIVGRAGLTPTDIMHVQGIFEEWDVEAAELGLKIMADRLNMGEEHLINVVRQKVEKELFLLITRHLVERNVPRSHPPLDDKMLRYFELAFDGMGDEIRSSFSTSLPLIGIGAPTHVYLSNVAAAFGTTAIIPENAGVANAVGAITGSVVGEERVLVRPVYSASGISKYSCHSTSGYAEFKEYELALEWARGEAREGALLLAGNMGGGGLEVQVQAEEKSSSGRAGNDLFLETWVVGRAVGSSRKYAIYGSRE